MKHVELNEHTGAVETHTTFECGHCDEPSERANKSTPTCPHCQQSLCPCCAPCDCPEATWSATTRDGGAS